MNFRNFKTFAVRIGTLTLFSGIAFTGLNFMTFQEPYASLNGPLAPFATMSRTFGEIVRGDTQKKQVIFTFDGGASDESAEQIFLALEKHRVKGTFFLTGKFVEKYPDVVRKMVADGDEIFSHTYDHPHLTQLSDAEIADEFSKMDSLLRQTAGVSAKPFFRAPYGDRDSRVVADAEKAGYRSVYWTVDALDWEGNEKETTGQVSYRIISKLSPGNIYLVHIGDSISGKILDDVFTQIENRGYKIVSLTQGLPVPYRW